MSAEGASTAAPVQGPFRKAIGAGLLPQGAPYRLQFQFAASLGFEAVEMK
jgi:hypothetical protein